MFCSQRVSVVVPVLSATMMSCFCLPPDTVVGGFTLSTWILSVALSYGSIVFSC